MVVLDIDSSVALVIVTVVLDNRGLVALDIGSSMIMPVGGTYDNMVHISGFREDGT